MHDAGRALGGVAVARVDLLRVARRASRGGEGAANCGKGGGGVGLQVLVLLLKLVRVLELLAGEGQAW